MDCTAYSVPMTSHMLCGPSENAALYGKTDMRCSVYRLKSCVINLYHSYVTMALFIKLKHSDMGTTSTLATAGARSEHQIINCSTKATSCVTCSGCNVNSVEHRHVIWWSGDYQTLLHLDNYTGIIWEPAFILLEYS